MGFRFLPKSVTLNDFQGRNGFIFVLFFFAELLAFVAHYVKVVD